MTTFGRAMRAEWPLDPEVTYLNHGTVGVTPRVVMAAQQAIRDDIERQPSRFILRELSPITVGGPPRRTPRLRDAADAIAPFFGARGADLVFVDNTTTGANAVLRSFPLEAGDEILVTDHGYGGVVQAARFAARQRGATVRTAALPYPATGPDEIAAAIAGATTPHTRLAIIDHITSASALILPLAPIAAALKAKGIAVIGDGAHAPGSIPLDIPALGVDWYIANLHKWMWVPRSSGILWASPERQQALHAPVTSWGLDQGFADEFDAPGTRDPSAHLAAPAALAFLESLGVERVQQYNHRLAWAAAQSLAESFDTTFDPPESMVPTMATVRLPEEFGTSKGDADALRDRLLYDDHIEVQVHAFHERVWIRVSAQIYNDMADVERLARAVLDGRPQRT